MTNLISHLANIQCFHALCYSAFLHSLGGDLRVFLEQTRLFAYIDSFHLTNEYLENAKNPR